ncbi:MAG TPA: hypothetical protein VJQ82_26570, partial [Terriglobales bacterium]|nr:hypothetical protein [Terriglobales bacterium]
MPVVSFRISGKMGKVLFRLAVDLSPRPFKQRLIETPIAHFAGQVANGGKQPVRQRYDAIKERSESIICVARNLCLLQAAFQDREDKRHLLFRALMGFIDPEQGFF